MARKPFPDDRTVRRHRRSCIPILVPAVPDVDVILKTTHPDKTLHSTNSPRIIPHSAGSENFLNDSYKHGPSVCSTISPDEDLPQIKWPSADDPRWGSANNELLDILPVNFSSMTYYKSIANFNSFLFSYFLNLFGPTVSPVPRTKCFDNKALRLCRIRKKKLRSEWRKFVFLGTALMSEAPKTLDANVSA